MNSLAFNPEPKTGTRRVCTLQGSDCQAWTQDAQQATPLTDLFELRLDFLERFDDLEAFLDTCPGPVLLTLRSQEEGGQWSGSDQIKKELLHRLAEHQVVHAVDLEWNCPIAFPKDVFCIRSRHMSVFQSPDQWPSSLGEDADLHKWAMPVSSSQVMNLKTWQKERPNWAIIPMGEGALLGRCLQDVFGSPLVYGHSGSHGLPGQIDLNLLQSLDFNQGAQRFFAVIGQPVDHSPSPAFHQPHLGAGSRYVAINSQDPQLITQLSQDGFLGFSVTTPLKEKVLSICDQLSPIAEKAQAVNTVLIKDDHICGDNTDGPAMASLVQGAGQVLVLGTGGLAKAVLASLDPDRCLVSGRDWNKSQTLAKQFGCQTLPWEKRGQKVDAVLQCTSVGFSVKGSPLENSMFHSQTLYVESILHPLKTDFVKRAEIIGAKVLTGDHLFTAQAKAQSRLFKQTLCQQAAL